jgi:anti-sigma factor RsiW
MNHLNEEQFVLYYYGEQSEGVEDHLGACEHCRDAYHTLQRVLNSVDSLPVPERGADYEAQVWRQVSEKLPRKGSFASRWFTWKPLVAAAAMAVLVVAAFLAGRTWHTPGASHGPGVMADSQVRERVLMVAVGDHLERSQTVLVELSNAGAPSSGALDISYEQRAAEDLVESNRLYRQTAMSAGDAATANLLEELENVLLDIAHSPSEVSEKQLEDLRREIEGRGILFKVKVFGTQVQERQSAQNAPSL